MAEWTPMFWKLVLFSLSAVPVSVIANKMLKYLLKAGYPSAVIAATGILVLVGFAGLAFRFFGNDASKKKIKDPFFYCFALFAFTAIIDLGIGLELDGYITDFLTAYLLSGEPYLASPYGAVICYWDGFGLYSMYLFMIHRIINNKSYRSMALYWSGNITNSMVVLLLSIFVGKHGVFPATVLNVPYLALPVLIGWHFLQNRPQVKTQGSAKPLSERPLDIAFVAFLIFAIGIAILRAVAVLDQHLWFPKFYMEKIEPLLMLKDPCPFLKIQMLIYLFYMVPVYLMSIHALIRPGCTWMVDLTLIHAGLSSQAQFSYIATALHSGIKEEFRIPKVFWMQMVFWIVNLSLLVIPHLLLFRCLKCDKLFTANALSSSSSNDKANKKAK